jgi:hypothetical protein
MARIDHGLRVGSALSPGKANVVADVLSCNAHYNYLPAMHLSHSKISNFGI